MDPSKFKVGEKYRYSEIPEESTDDFTVSDYGLEYIGQNAIHIRFFKGEVDVWFIWDSMGNEANFMCVYNK